MILMKLFKTVDNDIVLDCCNFSKFSLPSEFWFNSYQMCLVFQPLNTVRKFTLVFWT